MRIVTDVEMRAADEATFSDIGVPSAAVMESAGRSIASFLENNFSQALLGKTLIVCGSGNNGGDGYVCARTLRHLGYSVQTLSLKPVSALRGDAKIMAEAWLRCGGETIEVTPDTLSDKVFSGVSLLVDAILGTGFSGAARGIAVDIITHINQLAKQRAIPVVAVDLPSGVETNTGLLQGVAIEAQATVALQSLKFAHVLFPATKNCGEVYVADVGVTLNERVSAIETSLLTARDIAAVIQTNLKSDPESHKGRRGRLAVVGGSLGHYGAPKMSARAGLVVGAGLVTLYVPKSVTKTIAAELGELMCDGLADDTNGNFSGADVRKDVARVTAQRHAIVLGPGIGTEDGARQLVAAVLAECKEKSVNIVIDADALNCIALDKKLRSLLGPHSVLTPHPGEMARLKNCPVEEVLANRLTIARELRDETGATIVMKGARTVIARADGSTAINPAATEALATAGSGDVLAGTIGGLLARGLSPGDASCAGVFVHGASAELVVQDKQGELGIVAGDFIAALPRALNILATMKISRSPLIRKVLPGSLHAF